MLLYIFDPPPLLYSTALFSRINYNYIDLVVRSTCKQSIIFVTLGFKVFRPYNAIKGRIVWSICDLNSTA